MTLLDFILNVAGLLLWLKWRTVPSRARWFYLLGLAGLLVIRAVFYWLAGPQWNWHPGIPLGPVHLFFRSDLFGRMLLFSCFSFAATLGLFYLFLLTLSSLHSSLPDANPAQRLVRWHLGPLERWPNAAKLLLPMLVTVVAWFSVNPLLLKIQMLPPETPWHVLAHGAVIGLASYLVLKFLVAGFLILHLLHSYVYLGDFAFWDFVDATARALLRPLRWLPLSIGRVDLLPVVALALVLLAANWSQFGLNHLYR